ncbi:hypothetical protein BKA70DRAFT_744577 [Coprinopsis sp. MPI-PUGE-AT-0042]|nr:hypothetical protein BKA70DRAFT_744577 [Coprinopsis sp. MPI-PUGE-AT-0042]
MSRSISSSLMIYNTPPRLKPPIPKLTHRGISTTKNATRVVRRISTLDPSKLIPDDWVDFRGYQAPTVRFAQTGRAAVLNYAHPMNQNPWPSSARGFLYFHRPHTTGGNHPAAGCLRLRSVDSPDGLDGAFDTSTCATNVGTKDVLIDRGGCTVPWSLPLLRLRMAPSYSAILAQLQLDGLVAPESLAKLDELALDWKRVLIIETQVLDDITQPWILNLDHQSSRLIVLAEDKIYTTQTRNVTMSEEARTYAAFKQGVASVRFELLPWQERIVLRLLKYLVPPDPRIVSQNLGQTEGELIWHYSLKQGANAHWLPRRTWSVDPSSLFSRASISALADKYS